VDYKLNKEASNSFYTECFSKWILSGEHTVLRGGEALVFPFKNKSLKFSYKVKETDTSLKLKISGEFGNDLEILFTGLLEKALSKVVQSLVHLKGEIEVTNNIPLGSGLGASASLCVAVARFFCYQRWIQEDHIIDFAKDLENIFHGESSGVDVTVVHLEKPLCFRRNEKPIELNLSWQPCWALTYSGQRGITKECVEKVKALREINFNLANRIDEQMKMATNLCKKSLTEDFNEASLKNLTEGLALGRGCFDQWELTPQKALTIEALTVEGIRPLVVKPTGSGNGGYVLSLWKSRVSHPDLVWIG